MKPNRPNNVCRKNGECFSPKVDCEVHDEKSGRQKYWFGNVCIGEEYFETDRYRSKDCAISEMLGYLEGISSFINAEIKNLQNLLKE